MHNKYTLPDLNFIGGETQDLVFYLMGVTNHRVNAYNIQCTFSLINYADRFRPPQLVKNAEIITPDQESETSYFEIHLTSDETIDLFGKFVYQVTLKDSEQNTEIYQGILNIFENINPKIPLRTSLA